MRIYGKVYENNEEKGTIEIQGHDELEKLRLGTLWSLDIEWLNQVKEKVNETWMKPYKCETCDGYILTLRPSAVVNFRAMYPVKA